MTTPGVGQQTGCAPECHGTLGFKLLLSVPNISQQVIWRAVAVCLLVCLAASPESGKHLSLLVAHAHIQSKSNAKEPCLQGLDRFLLHVNPSTSNSESAHMQLQCCASMCLVSFNRCKPSHFLSQYRLERPHKLAFPHGRVAFDLPLLAHLLQILHLRTSRPHCVQEQMMDMIWAAQQGLPNLVWWRAFPEDALWGLTQGSVALAGSRKHWHRPAFCTHSSCSTGHCPEDSSVKKKPPLSSCGKM
jgi:hypothetical protein